MRNLKIGNRKDRIQLMTKNLELFRMPKWEHLPDAIRSKEVCTLTNDLLLPIFPAERELLSPAMLQNYLRWGILPPVDGRKYNREQICWILTITLLKNVITIKEIKKGILLQLKLMEAKEAYNILCEEVERAFSYMSDTIFMWCSSKESEDTLRFDSFDLDPSRLAIGSVCRALAFQIFTQMALREDGIAETMEKLAQRSM